MVEKPSLRVGGVVTIAVLGFQLMIFVSMFIALLMGRGWLKTATGFWVLITLFGSI